MDLYLGEGIEFQLLLSMMVSFAVLVLVIVNGFVVVEGVGILFSTNFCTSFLTGDFLEIFCARPENVNRNFWYARSARENNF